MSNAKITAYIGAQILYNQDQIAYVHMEDLTGRERLLIFDELSKSYRYAHKNKCIRALACNWVPLRPNSYNLSEEAMESFMSSCLEPKRYELLYAALHSQKVRKWIEDLVYSNDRMQVKEFDLSPITPPASSQAWDLGSPSIQEPSCQPELFIRTIAEQDAILEKLWDDFSMVPMDLETEEMEGSFLHFPVGTPREDIWHWFDGRYSKGVVSLLRFGCAESKVCFECETRDCVYNHDGECRYVLVHERSPKITPENGCESGEIPSLIS